MRSLLSTLQKWAQWSLRSKLIAIGVFLAMISMVIAQLTWSETAERKLTENSE